MSTLLVAWVITGTALPPGPASLERVQLKHFLIQSPPYRRTIRLVHFLQSGMVAAHFHTNLVLRFKMISIMLLSMSV